MRGRASKPPKHVLREHAVSRVRGVLDAEAGSLDHRLEKPAERRVLLPDMLLELRSSPALLSVKAGAGTPGFEAVLSLGGIEAVHHVPQAEHATWSKNAAEVDQGDPLPEVGKVMECIARVDEVCRASLVLITQEAGPHHLNVPQPRVNDLRSQ